MRVASLWLRLLAALLDAAVGIGSMAAAVGAGFAGAIVYERVCRTEGGDGDEENRLDVAPETGRFALSSWPVAVLRGASTGLAVAGRNWRGPGFRALGLRRVDAQTGGVVSVRSALIGVVFDQAWQSATTPLFGSLAQQRRDRFTALEPQLRAAQRKYADDPQARQRAVMEFYKANNLSPFAGCGWQLAGPAVAQLILAFGSRGGRTVRDRITGTSVILDR